jgi:hypothetical protein
MRPALLGRACASDALPLFAGTVASCDAAFAEDALGATVGAAADGALGATS